MREQGSRLSADCEDTVFMFKLHRPHLGPDKAAHFKFLAVHMGDKKLLLSHDGLKAAEGQEYRGAETTAVADASEVLVSDGYSVASVRVVLGSVLSESIHSLKDIEDVCGKVARRLKLPWTEVAMPVVVPPCTRLQSVPTCAWDTDLVEDVLLRWLCGDRTISTPEVCSEDNYDKMNPDAEDGYLCWLREELIITTSMCRAVGTLGNNWKGDTADSSSIPIDSVTVFNTKFDEHYRCLCTWMGMPADVLPSAMAKDFTERLTWKPPPPLDEPMEDDAHEGDEDKRPNTLLAPHPLAHDMCSQKLSMARAGTKNESRALRRESAQLDKAKFVGTLDESAIRAISGQGDLTEDDWEAMFPPGGDVMRPFASVPMAQERAQEAWANHMWLVDLCQEHPGLRKSEVFCATRLRGQNLAMKAKLETSTVSARPYEILPFVVGCGRALHAVAVGPSKGRNLDSEDADTQPTQVITHAGDGCKLVV